MKDILKENLSKHKYIWISLLIILIYVAPLFILGEDAHMLIHDNLDSNVTWYKILYESGNMFGELDSIIPNIGYGVPRNGYGSELSVLRLMYYLLSPYYVYAVNQVLIRLVAFSGMYLFLKKYIVKDNKMIQCGVALCFSLLPFWPSAGISIASQPLALYCFLNIKRREDKWKEWLILALIPFYSSFILSGVFFLCMIGIIWIYDSIKNRKINFRFMLAIIMMGLIYLCVEYRSVFNMFLDSNYVSHRTVWKLSGKSFEQSITEIYKNFTVGHYHAQSLQKYIINFTVYLSIILMLIRRKINKPIIYLLFLNFSISVLHGFWEFKGLAAIKEKFSILTTFRFSRFNWLHALFWHILFALALMYIIESIREYNEKIELTKIKVHINKIITIIISSLILLQVLFAFYKSDFFTERRLQKPTFRQYYSEKLFEEIRDYIGKPQNEYRIISIGLDPAISQYNGFYTLDGYLADYPLEYKNQFRQIMYKELEKSKDANGFYYIWGSKFYIFADEIYRNFKDHQDGYIITKEDTLSINNLQLNTRKLKELGCEYVFSALPINNAENNRLNLERVFENDESAWKIYLYKIR